VPLAPVETTVHVTTDVSRDGLTVSIVASKELKLPDGTTVSEEIDIGLSMRPDVRGGVSPGSLSIPAAFYAASPFAAEVLRGFLFFPQIGEGGAGLAPSLPEPLPQGA
jgi:hypothetical protein